MSELKLNNVRLSFPKLVEPEAFVGRGGETSKPRYSCTFLIPKTDTATITAIKQAMLAAAEEKWMSKGADELKNLYANLKTALIDGDSQSYDGYEGHWALRCAAQVGSPPTLVDQQAKLYEPREKALTGLYAGAYVNAIVRFWAQGAESGFGKRLNASVGGVQFYADGDAFAAKAVSADAFEPAPHVDAFADDVGAEAKSDAKADGLDDMF